MKYVLLALLGMFGMLLAAFFAAEAFLEFKYPMILVWVLVLGCCFGVAVYAYDKIRDHFGNEAVDRFLSGLSKRI